VGGDRAAMVAWAFIGFGVLLLLTHFFLQLIGRYRGYLIFLAMASLFLGASRFARAEIAWLPLVLAAAALVWAFLEALQETRTRMEAFRKEAQEREAAFADMMREMSAMPQEDPPAPPPKPPDAER
jgi:hypothetical protein